MQLLEKSKIIESRSKKMKQDRHRAIGLPFIPGDAKTQTRIREFIHLSDSSGRRLRGCRSSKIDSSGKNVSL
jgi:hypothetical protein